MIIEHIIYKCRDCGSEKIVKNGRNRYGNQQYLCKVCGNCRVLKPQKQHLSVKNSSKQQRNASV